MVSITSSKGKRMVAEKEEVKDERAKSKEDHVKLLRKAKEEYKGLLISRPNVIGIGIGNRIKGGKELDEMVIKVYVKQKVPKNMLSKNDILPPLVPSWS